MAEYVARRVAYALLTLLGITLAVFVLIHSVPGDPITYYLSAGTHSISPEIVEQIRRANHLDRPIPEQYLIWLGKTLRLDFGHSFASREPVVKRIGSKLPNTLILNACAFAVALVVALPLGFASAAKAGRWIDRGSGLVLLLLYSLPSFWVALVLMQLFAVELRLLPLFGITSHDYGTLSLVGRIADRLWHLVLPVVTLAYGQFALFARFSRSAVLEAVNQPFVLAARARGVSQTRAVVSHAGRNALLPLVTLLGVSVPYLLSGSVIVETIFAWDGLGRLYYDAVLFRDYPVVMGLTVLTAVATLLAYLFTDLLYPIVDPRLRRMASR